MDPLFLHSSVPTCGMKPCSSVLTSGTDRREEQGSVPTFGTDGTEMNGFCTKLYCLAKIFV